MNFPVWQVGPANGAVLIAIVAVFHVFIAHLAIGGGIFLPVTEYFARKSGRDDLLESLKGQTHFFMVLTAVFGTVSGVGIWFTISLIQPAATTALIHKFVFGWGIEYALFLVEITSLIFYYYGWEKMRPDLHQKIGWIYAGSAIGSMVIINGILTFMLTPGPDPVTKVTSLTFLASFFNPTYWPSLLMRSLVCLSLGGLFGLYMAARMPRDSANRTWFLRYSSKWLIPAYALMGIAAIWYVSAIPYDRIQALTAGISTAGVGNLSILTRMFMLIGLFTVTIALMVFVGPYLNPTEFGQGKALAIILAALFVTGAGEWVREVVRKPYVIRDFMYSNSILAHPISGFPGDLEDTTRYHDTFLPRLKWRSSDDDGLVMFRNQCLACHTLSNYRSLRTYLAGRDQDSIESFLKTLQKGKENPYRGIMPPLLGNETEVKALAQFLYDQLPTSAAQAKVEEQQVSAN